MLPHTYQPGDGEEEGEEVYGEEEEDIGDGIDIDEVARMLQEQVDLVEQLRQELEAAKVRPSTTAVDPPHAATQVHGAE
jgi:hypothetical protein